MVPPRPPRRTTRPHRPDVSLSPFPGQVLDRVFYHIYPEHAIVEQKHASDTYRPLLTVNSFFYATAVKYLVRTVARPDPHLRRRYASTPPQISHLALTRYVHLRYHAYGQCSSEFHNLDSVSDIDVLYVHFGHGFHTAARGEVCGYMHTLRPRTLVIHRLGVLGLPTRAEDSVIPPAVLDSPTSFVFRLCQYLPAVGSARKHFFAGTGLTHARVAKMSSIVIIFDTLRTVNNTVVLDNSFAVCNIGSEGCSLHPGQRLWNVLDDIAKLISTAPPSTHLTFVNAGAIDADNKHSAKVSWDIIGQQRRIEGVFRARLGKAFSVFQNGDDGSTFKRQKLKARQNAASFLTLKQYVTKGNWDGVLNICEARHILKALE